MAFITPQVLPSKPYSGADPVAMSVSTPRTMSCTSHVRLGANFSSDHDKTGGDQRLACAAKLRGVGRLTRGGDVALLRKIDLLRENGVEDGVGNLVATLSGWPSVTDSDVKT